uniref:Uncharacterized protein n=1 Tax=viral metagenome TaxID=1070528 RepID=A0A6C0J3N3_9ZZZZ
MVKNKDTENNDNNDKNKTKTSFSSIGDDNIDDFQTANMIHKMKKIKKNKIKKNYKKMEGFNTLDNISNIENHENNTINEDEKTENSNIFDSLFDKIKNLLGKHDNSVETFEDHEYEGHDNVKEPKSKTHNIRMKIIKAINDSYAKVNKINTDIATGIVKGLSQNKTLSEFNKINEYLLETVGKNANEFVGEIMDFANNITNDSGNIINKINNSVDDIADDTIDSVSNIVEKTSRIKNTLTNIELPPRITDILNIITQECDKVVNTITEKSEIIYKDIDILDNIENTLQNIEQGVNTNIENTKDALKTAGETIESNIENTKDSLKTAGETIESNIENTKDSLKTTGETIKSNIESMTDDKNYNKYKKKQKIQRMNSMNKTITDDIALVRNSIVLIETAALSLWVVYNWYFLMFYAPDNDIYIPKFSRFELLKQSNKSNSYSSVPGLKKMILYLFEFAIWFPEKLDGFLINNDNFFSFPGLTKHLLNGDSKFILIYLIGFYCIKNFAVSFKNFFIDLLTNANGNKLINIMFAIVLILFFVSAFTFSFVGDMEADTNIMFSFVSGMLNPIGTFIVWLIRFFITITISVPMGAIICGLYLIIYSLFGRFIYGFTTNMGDMDDHIKTNTAQFENKDMCNTGSLWNMFYFILRFLFKIMEFIKKNILTIAYFLIFVYTTFTMITNLSSQMNNKEILIFLIVCITISIFIQLFIQLRKYIKNENDDSYDDKMDDHGFQEEFDVNKDYSFSKNTDNNSNKLEKS